MSTPRNIAELDATAKQVERSRWLSERLGWLVCSCIVVSATVGLCGQGWLSTFHQTSDDGRSEISGYQLDRYETPTKLVVRTMPSADGKSFALTMSHAFVDAIELHDMVPPPLRAELGADGVNYHFATIGSPAECVVVVRYQYVTWGRLTIECGHPASPLSQQVMVLP